MKTAQQGDRVQVHYVKRFEDGTRTSSRERLEVTVGEEHPLLPGLGLALVGLPVGGCKRVRMPAETAAPPTDAGRILRLARNRFPQQLLIGARVQILNRHGRRRLVRIVEVRDQAVVVDTRHRAAGLSMELEIRLVAIQLPKDREGDENESGYASL